MSLLQGTIVYVWLVPVFIQIVFPLAMLILWLGLKILENLFGKETRASKTVESLDQVSFKEAV